MPIIAGIIGGILSIVAGIIIIIWPRIIAYIIGIYLIVVGNPGSDFSAKITV